jgi:hypothetical protein
MSDTPYVQQWKKDTEIWMCRLCLISPEPDHEVDFWLDDAAEADQWLIPWVHRTWSEIRNLTSTDLEMRLAALRRTEIDK